MIEEENELKADDIMLKRLIEDHGDTEYAHYLAYEAGCISEGMFSQKLGIPRIEARDKLIMMRAAFNKKEATPLNWGDDDESSSIYIAETPFGSYVISKPYYSERKHNCFYLEFEPHIPDTDICKFTSLKEAKAAAELDWKNKNTEEDFNK